MLDQDLARLYGVTTKRLNEALKRNRQRFPEDFAFRLAASETAGLRSQNATSNLHIAEIKGKGRVRSLSVTANSIHAAVGKRGGRRSMPWVFTEHGALMAANILRSARAVQMSVFVIRAFVRMREQSATNAAIFKRLSEIDGALLEHDNALRDLYRKLLPLLEPRPDPPTRRIGFIKDED